MIYLNNAATSYPKPETVLEAVNAYIHSPPVNQFRSGTENKFQNIQNKCRKKLARLFNVKTPERIIFTSGATESLNLAIKGLQLYNCHVITTSNEHNSVLRPLKLLEREYKLELSIVYSDHKGDIDVNKLASVIKKNTAAIIINHCSNVTGSMVNLEEISRLAQEKNILLIVDASQSAGIVHIDLEKSPVDVLAFTGHKGLFGLQGIGGLYINDNLLIKPLKVGGTGIKSNLLHQPKELPLYYEAGTQNLPGIVSLNAGVEFVLNTGVDQIAAKNAHMFKIAYDGLINNPGIIVYGEPGDCKHSNSMISFNIKEIMPEEIAYILAEVYNIELRAGLQCAPLIHKSIGSPYYGCLRASWSYLTPEEHVCELIKAVNQVQRNKEVA